MSNITYSKNVSLDTFSQIKIDIEHDKGIVWKYLKPFPRPCLSSIKASCPVMASWYQLNITLWIP